VNKSILFKLFNLAVILFYIFLLILFFIYLFNKLEAASHHINQTPNIKENKNQSNKKPQQIRLNKSTDAYDN